MVLDSQARCSAGGSVSGPTATNCVLVLRPRRKERPTKGPPPHVVCCATRDGQLSFLSRLVLPKVGLPHC